MAEAARDHSDSKRTVDDLFQFLTRVRGFRPAVALDKILKALRRDRLQIDYHIRGGTRKGTLEELRERKATGAPLNHLLETAPPEGIAGPVDFQFWGKLLNLTIRDECLIVEPNGAHDYPWDAYSFTVANWSLVEELWPNPNRARSDLSAPASNPEAPSAPTNPPSAAAATRSAPSESAAASDPAHGPKMQRSAWLKAYLTAEKKKELANKYDQVGKAADAVNRDMESDARVNAYKNPRSIEPFLIAARLYAPRQSPK